MERDHVLDSLAEHLKAAEESNGRAVLLAGEAGVGKSSVVDQFERSTPTTYWAHGACDGLFTPRPLGPLFDMAAELEGTLLEGCRRNAPRDELFRLLLDDLSARDGTTVLVIEDVHWADESTLDLLRFLGRRVRHLPVLLLITFRDDELGNSHPLRLVLGELATHRSTRRIDLAPLSEDAVYALAADSGIDARELFELSGGNPFFVTEVLESRTNLIPPSARDAVLARLLRLTPDARRLAEAAALIGPRVDDRFLEDVALGVVQHLDDLIASGLLVHDADGLRFRHEIGRLAVEQEVSAHRRTRLHSAILRALQDRGCEDDARLAHHAEGADDVAAVRHYAPRAAALASALESHREAATQYERALRYADQGDAASIAELHDALVQEHSLTDTWDRAAEAAERSLGLWRQLGDVRREGAVMYRLARIMRRLARPGEKEYAQGAVALLEPLGPSVELASSYAIAAMTMEFGAEESGLVLARRAQQLAIELDVPDVLSDALNTEACLVSIQGGNWRPIMEQALDVAVARGAHAQAGRAYSNMVVNLQYEGRAAECGTYFDEGIEYCDLHDLGDYGLRLRAGRSEWLLSQGRWEAAIDLARSLLTTQVSSPGNRTSFAIVVGTVLARRGDATAWIYLDEALAHARRSGGAARILDAYPASAEAHWLAGDVDAAQADLIVTVGALGGSLPRVAAFVAAWCRRVGVELPPISLAEDDPWAQSLSGDFDAAVAQWDARGMPYESALALYDSGTEEGLRDAIRRFEALGASAAVEAARREMRRLGIRSIPAGARASTRAHPLGLTQREAEVLDGICAGRTNAEISRQLYLSTRTVDHHVSSVLAKLGVSTRAEAATEAARRASVSQEG